VPLPGAIDDHQTANAAALGQVGAAWVMPQPQFTAQAVTALLATLLRDPAGLATAAAAARAQSRVSAVDALADLVERAIVRETQS
jgi:UDP-N-acetylglucosamine--N-acetylmuramyl-(pentapeptide) pyrophosphoryl-undecaprenol N-acetylglucosamine transferase